MPRHDIRHLCIVPRCSPSLPALGMVPSSPLALSLCYFRSLRLSSCLCVSMPPPPYVALVGAMTKIRRRRLLPHEIKNDVESLRLRTGEHEMIIALHDSFTLVVVQQVRAIISLPRLLLLLGLLVLRVLDVVLSD